MGKVRTSSRGRNYLFPAVSVSTGAAASSVCKLHLQYLQSADISFVWCFSKKFISEVFLSHKIPSLQVTMASLSLHFTQSPFDLECVIKEWRMDRGREQRRFYWEGRGGGERCSFDGPLQRWLSSGGAIAIAARCLFLNFHSARQPPIPMCDLLLLSEMLNN